MKQEPTWPWCSGSSDTLSSTSSGSLSLELMKAFRLWFVRQRPDLWGPSKAVRSKRGMDVHGEEDTWLTNSEAWKDPRSFSTDGVCGRGCGCKIRSSVTSFRSHRPYLVFWMDNNLLNPHGDITWVQDQGIRQSVIAQSRCCMRLAFYFLIIATKSIFSFF